MKSKVTTLLSAVSPTENSASAAVSCQRIQEQVGAVQLSFATFTAAANAKLSIQGRLRPTGPWAEVASIDIDALFTTTLLSRISSAVPIMPQMRVQFLADGGVYAVTATGATVELME